MILRWPDRVGSSSTDIHKGMHGRELVPLRERVLWEFQVVVQTGIRGNTPAGVGGNALVGPVGWFPVLVFAGVGPAGR